MNTRMFLIFTRSLPVTVVLVSCLITNAVVAEERELLGSGRLLEILDPHRGGEAPADANRPRSFLADIDEFDRTRTALDARTRADRWIGLAFEMSHWDQADIVQSYGALDEHIFKPVGFDSLLRVLPEPSEWGELWNAFERYDAAKVRPAYLAGLRLFLAALNPGESGLEDALAKLKEVISHVESDREKEMLQRLIPSLDRALAYRSNDPLSLLAQAEAQAKSVDSQEGSVVIPDVMTLLGADDGRKWLERILLSAVRSVSVPVGELTRNTAREIVLDRIDDLQVGHWGLVTDFTSAMLYEALVSRFPSANSYADLYGVRRTAQIYYLLSLVGAGRPADASKLLVAMARENEFTLTADMIQDLQKAGYSGQVQKFFQALLADDPRVKIWESYLTLSARTGRTREAARFVDELLGRADIPADRQADLWARYAEVLLALNDVDRALPIMSSRIDGADLDTKKDLGLKLARLGMLLGRKELVDNGIRVVREVLEKSRGDESAYWRESAVKSFIELAHELDRLATAESFLRDEIRFVRDYMDKYADVAGEYAEVYLSQSLKPIAVDVAGMYAAAGEWDEVINWVDGYPYWGTADATDLLSAEDSTGARFGLHLAAALAHGDQIEPAIEIAKALLEIAPGDDRVYALFAELAGTGANPEFDRLFELDPFEERPMIWKAVIEFGSGDVDGARRSIETAIAVDPSDGEQGPGDRMRAYAVYADVLERMGDSQKAQIMRDAVAAIRLSEEADKAYDAGLYSKAIDMYKESAEKFDGAYCVQSRLAIQLTDRGRFEEARGHFERAYELMPASFGRVESHCFRCENAFKDSRAQDIAESVFGEMLRTQPKDARAQYMMGYLRTEQRDYAGALRYFRAAVGIDPLYLNAWKQIGKIAEKMYLEEWEVNTVALKIKELDLLGRHSSVDYNQISDLASLWQLASVLQDKTKERRVDLYPLRASAEQLKQSQVKNEHAVRFAALVDGAGRRKNESRFPGLELGRTTIVAAAKSAMVGRFQTGF